MKLICLNCGKPWNYAEGAYDEETGFERKGWLLVHCPTCKCRLSHLDQILDRFRHQLEELSGDGWTIEGDQSELSSKIENFVISLFLTTE